MVDHVEGNEFVGEKAKRPASVPFGRLAGRESDEMGFVVAIEFAVVVAVGMFALDGFEPVTFVELFPGPPRRSWATVE
jgi:hypothetical protein